MALLERKSVQFSSGVKDAVDNDVVELVIRTQLRLVERVFCFAHLLRIKIPIARGDLKAAFFVIDNLLHVGSFAFCVRHCRRREMGEKSVYGRNVVRGLIFELIRRPIRITQQLRFLSAQLRCAQDNIARVELPAFAVPGERCLHDALAQWSILQRAEQRLPSRVLKLNDQLAFLVLGFRSRNDASHLVVCEAGQLFFAIDDDRGRIPFFEHVLLKLRLQSRQLGINLLQLLFVGVGQFRACPHKILVIPLE